MGEPLYNYENVAEALNLYASWQRAAKRHITLSTSGRCAANYPESAGRRIGVKFMILFMLRITSCDPRLWRSTINILWKSCWRLRRNYPCFCIAPDYLWICAVGRREWHGWPCSGISASLYNIPCKINLIPFNAWAGSGFQCSPLKRIEGFAEFWKEQVMMLRSVVPWSGYFGGVRSIGIGKPKKSERAKRIKQGCLSINGGNHGISKNKPVVEAARAFEVLQVLLLPLIPNFLKFKKSLPQRCFSCASSFRWLCCDSTTGRSLTMIDYCHVETGHVVDVMVFPGSIWSGLVFSP